MAEDADLLAELEADSRVPSICTVCAWLEGRDDAPLWDKAFSNDQITSAAILRGMQKRGFRHKAKPVSNHRTEKHRVAA